jgi:CHRD domain-containing protein
MKRIALLVCAMLLVSAGVVLSVGISQIKAILTGWEEVPVISTDASGELRARINKDEDQVEFELTYSDLEADATQAHIHVGQPGVNGGISVWLCSNLASPPTPAGFNRPCPLRGGTVTGTFGPADVVGPASQGVAAGEFDELVRAIRERKTYANVHSTLFPGGEIRSQIDPGRGEGHHH